MSETFSQMFLFNFQSFQWAKVKQWRSSTRFHLFVNKSWINSCSRVWHRSAICRLHVSRKNTLSLINKSSRVSQFVYFDFFPGKTVGPILKSIDFVAIIYYYYYYFSFLVGAFCGQCRFQNFVQIFSYNTHLYCA